jgi:3',5'-cyclic AMP phosphodiesterase CpdA
VRRAEAVRTIVHLSDLHFGRIEPPLPRALLRAVVEAVPDLVVVSGDLTQRARSAEFKAAAQFLRTLPSPSS